LACYKAVTLLYEEVQVPNHKRPSSVVHHLRILDGRPGFLIHGKWGYVSVLEGGGHICELILHSAGAVNPMWRPTWKTIDPEGYTPRKHLYTYGPPPEGKLLAGIAGPGISGTEKPRLVRGFLYPWEGPHKSQ